MGIILPPLIDWLNKHVVNDDERFLVACLTCLLVGVALDFPQILQGDANNLPYICAAVFSIATACFQAYWKPYFRSAFQQKIGVSY